MRSGAISPNRGGLVLLLTLVTLAASPLIAEKTQCECSKPPGGSHGCEDQQIAYCKTKNGECVGWCGSVKTPKQRGENLAAAILSESLGVRVTPRELRENYEYRSVYERFLGSGDSRGAYQVIKGAEKVFVQVPSSIQDRVAALEPTHETEPKDWFRWFRRDSTQTAGTQVDDAAITSAIKAKLAANGDINPFNIEVDSEEGIVTLQGVVAKEETRIKAEQLARGTTGVRRVINLVKVGDSS
jgi:hyperosmotically inducible periplasmic protein